ncbi:E3 ubiquitin-protein ligase pellino homolog 3 isoform X2 [Microcaecilia unicolor]|uniref:E3 ubiquitin-protein ligase pellino homolog 3 isoform X2 n=1 Tax=Microcaecilia unicolor TaxID=1415580 RepID=A0A6P7ZLS5_9AMPH|nr:E3 ubiquitin-protein ligase pellino homolog 3 isoform X2 [Microcaecilia unicolor]
MLLEGNTANTVGSQTLDLHRTCTKASQIFSSPGESVILNKDAVKYGELIVLGYNGSLANGDKGRRRSRLALTKRLKANGVKPDVIHHISTPLVSKALSNKGHHSISYTLSRSHSVIVEYTHDASTDMFQERAAKWRTPDGLMDGLTTNGVLVMHPTGGFSEDSSPGVWREISVCGNVYALRESRSAQQRGKLVENETNILQDGSLIDLCGATLLWRTTEGLRRTPTLKQLEALRQEINAARPQCPVGFNTLVFPSLAQREVVEKKQPWVYSNCGHVHGYHDWGFRKEKGGLERECPMCRRVGPYVPLWLGCEAGLYLDAGRPTHAFCPCGHVCSERTVRYWSQILLPHGTHAFHAACPFCGTWLTGGHEQIKLIFQGPVD